MTSTSDPSVLRLRARHAERVARNLKTDGEDPAGTLVLDPIRCDGRGLCHDAAPHLIELDEWGYPVLPGGTLRASVSRADLAAARDATHACPLLALHIEKPRA